MEENTIDSRLTIQVLDGLINVKTSVKSHDLTQGQVLVLHEGIPHTISATSDATLLLIVAR